MTLHLLKLRLLCYWNHVCWTCGRVQEHDHSFGWYCANCDMAEADAALTRRYIVAREVRKSKGAQ